MWRDEIFAKVDDVDWSIMIVLWGDVIKLVFSGFLFSSHIERNKFPAVIHLSLETFKEMEIGVMQRESLLGKKLQAIPREVYFQVQSQR